MKILVVCQYYYPEPFRITDICETLVKKKYDVTVLTGKPTYPNSKSYKDFVYKRKDEINGVKIIRCFEMKRSNKKFSLFTNYISFCFSASMKAFLLKEKFDLVFVYQLSPILMALPGVIYKKKHHVKLLAYCLDLWPASLISGGITKQSFAYKLFKAISKKIYNSSDLIMCTSNSFLKYFKQNLHLNHENLIYLPQYAEDVFENNSISNIEKLDLNIKERAYNFVFAGNIGEMQSVGTIIQAAELLKENKTIFFHIVGDGSKYNDCVELVNKLKLNNVFFYGRRPLEEMKTFYGIADAMLLTLNSDENISYTLPGKVQSYMAFGVPIIGAINGEAQDIINQSKSGFCCDSNDYKALAKLIVSFCNIENKNEFSINSKNFYETHFNKTIFFDKFESLIFKMRKMDV